MVRDIQTSILSYVNAASNALAGPSNTRPSSSVSPISPARPPRSFTNSSPYKSKRMGAPIVVGDDSDSDDSQDLSRITMEKHRSRPDDRQPDDEVERPMTLVEKREAQKRVLDSDDDTEAEVEDDVMVISDSEKDQPQLLRTTAIPKKPARRRRNPEQVDSDEDENKEGNTQPSSKRKVYLPSEDEEEDLPDLGDLINETPLRLAEAPRNNRRVTRSGGKPPPARTTRTTRQRHPVTPPPTSRHQILDVMMPPTPSDRDSYTVSPQVAKATVKSKDKARAAESSQSIHDELRRRSPRVMDRVVVETGPSRVARGGAEANALPSSMRPRDGGARSVRGGQSMIDLDSDSEDDFALEKRAHQGGSLKSHQSAAANIEDGPGRHTRSSRVRVEEHPTKAPALSPAKRKTRPQAPKLDIDDEPQQQPFAMFPSDPAINLEAGASEDDQPVRKRMSIGRTPRTHAIADSDEESVREPVEPVRRILKGKGKGRVQDPDELETSSEEEIETRAELLAEIEMDTPIVVENRLRDRGKQSTFQRNLDKLRARKLGKGKGHDLDSDEDDEGDASDDDIATLYDSDNAPSDDIHGFIEDDGAQFDSVNLPIEFRMASFQSLEHHAKVIFQYFVNLAVKGDSYAVEQDAAYYKVAFRALRKKLSGTKDSMVTSSVWRQNFKLALETYPEFHIITLDHAVDGCDACHIGGRMSKFIGQLEGYKYDKKTFSILPSSSDSDSESDEDDDFDRSKFKLGRFCRRRAEVFHDFSHWELAIYTAVAEPYNHLRQKCENQWQHDRTATAEGFDRKSIRDADKVLQWLEGRGVLQREWRRITAMIEAAQNLEKAGVGRGGVDDDL